MLLGSSQLKAVPGYVFSVTVAWEGVTLGETMWIRDTASAEVTPSNIRIPIAYPTANGTLHLEYAQGKYFANGIYFDKGATGGKVYGAVTYK